jgi:membrane fusion protein (multidrug efflux system)
MPKFLIFVVTTIALLAGIIIYNKVLHPQFGSVNKTAQNNRPLQVRGYVIVPQKLENNIRTSGTLVSSDNVDLHTQVSGLITKLNIKEGGHINKGTLIVKLFDNDLQAQLKKMQAQLETARRTESRLKQLLAINGVNQQDYDNALTQVKSNEADIENIKAQIEKTEIYAPFDGVIGLRNVSLGAYITPAITIASLQRIDPLRLDFTIPEKYASVISTGDPVKFTVDGFSNSFTANVFAIEPHIDEMTRTLKIRALVQNADAKLLPGAFAAIDLALKSIDDALMVPTQSIIAEERSNKIVIVKNGVAQFNVVQTGIRNDSLVQITTGVSAGDTVITSSILYLKPRLSVIVKLGNGTAMQTSDTNSLPVHKMHN